MCLFLKKKEKKKQGWSCSWHSSLRMIKDTLEPHGCISFKNREQVALLPPCSGDENKTELTNHDNNRNPRTETQTSRVAKLRINSLCMLDVPASLDIKRQRK